MIYALLGLGSVNILFITLFIRSAIANGKLRSENELQRARIEVQKKQLEIAGMPPFTDDQLFEWLRTGKLPK